MTWYRDGVPLSAGSRLSMSGEGASHQLDVTSCAANDVGQYSVKAEAGADQTTANFSLNVTARL